MRYISLTVLVMSVLLVGGCQVQNNAKKDRLNKMTQQVDQQELSLKKRIERKFNDANAHYKLGKYYQDMGQLEKAEYEYNLALGFDPVNRPAQAALVKTLKLAGREQRSAQLAQIYLDQVCVFAEDSLLLGRAFQCEGLEDYAIKCYEQALMLAPDSAALHKQMAYFYRAKGDKIRSEEYFKRSFQLNPYQADVAGELGKMGVVVKIPRKVKKDPLKDFFNGINIFKKKQATVPVNSKQ